MKHHQRILAAVLAVQIVLAAVILWPRAAVSGGAGEPLLGALSSDQIVAVAIEDADGNLIKFQSKTGSWVLPSADDYPVKEDNINEFVEKLVALDTGRLVTQTAASHKRLQVARDDFMRRIELTTADGESLILFLGSSPSYGATHVRLNGQDETYLTGDLNAWQVSADAGSWIDTSYLNIPQDEVTRINIQNDNGELVLEKDAEGSWTLAGLAADEELNSNTTSALVNQASTINMIAPLGTEEKEAYRMDRPQAIVTLETTGKTITLLIGATFVEDDSYVVKTSESPYYVRVNQYSIQGLVEKTRQDLIQLPPTPTPAAEESTP